MRPLGYGWRWAGVVALGAAGWLAGCLAPAEPGPRETAAPRDILLPTEDAADLGGGGKAILGPLAGYGFKVVVHARYDQQTGKGALWADETLLQQVAAKKPREFVFLELWRYDLAAKAWVKLEKPARTTTLLMRPSDAPGSKPPVDQLLLELTNQVGLYWAKWTEDKVQVEAPLYCGPINPNDLDIPPAPEGMIISAIPHENSGEAGYVPDPRIYCHSWNEFKNGNAVLRLGMTKAQVLEEIAKGGLKEFGGEYGIRKPDEAMQAKEIWHTSYGSFSGAAPGGGFLLLAFREGRLVAIVPHGPYPA